MSRPYPSSTSEAPDPLPGVPKATSVCALEQPACEPPSVSNRELALCISVSLALAATRLAFAGGPQLFNDSYQYLSVEANFRSSASLSTSIIHFDIERASGQIPAPATTFPPGYPVAIWALGWTRLAPEWIALLLSLAGNIAVFPLLRAIASGAGLNASGTRVCLVAWAVSAQAALYATSILAEAVFTAASLGALALLLKAESASYGTRVSGKIPACLLAGLSCWLRYAGLFLVAALHVHAAVQIRRDRARLGPWLASLVLCDAAVGILLWRNMASAGTWRGGNERQVRNSFGYVLHRLADAAYELALGSIRKPISLADILFATLFAVGALAALVLVARGRFARSGGDFSASRRRADPLLWYVGLYTMGMCYLGFTSQISLGGRMFLPVLPEMLVAALIVSRAEAAVKKSRTWASVAGLLLVVGFLGGNLRSIMHRPPPPPHHLVTEAIAFPNRDGVPLSTWIQRSIPNDAVIFAVHGQATGYILKRKTVSAGRTFTTVTWDEDEVRRTMSRFGAQFLLIFSRVLDGEFIDQPESQFLERLATRHPPHWLRIAAENQRAIIYRLN